MYYTDLCILGCVTRKESDGKDVNDTTKKQTEDATSQAKPEKNHTSSVFLIDMDRLE